MSWILTAGIWLRALAGPFWGNLADRRAAHRQLVFLLALGSAALCALFTLDLGFAGILLVSIPFTMLYFPMIALIDGLTISWTRRTANDVRALDYGRLRLWGSLSFLVVSIAAGTFLEGRSLEWVIALLLAGLAASAVAAAALPAPENPQRATRLPLRELLVRRDFLLLLAAAGLIQGSHGCYYAYGSIHWKNAGIEEGWIGWLWAEGVIAEVVLFIVAPRLFRWRPTTLLMVGATSALVRWILLAEFTDLGALVAVQWMHGLSFGMTHLAAVSWITKNVSEEQTASAQALLAAMTAGVVLGLATLLCGELFDSYGGTTFYAMSAMALFGLAAARVLRSATSTRTSARL